MSTTKKTPSEELKVWNHKVKSEDEKAVIVKDIDLKIVSYKTEDNLDAIRLAIYENGELMDKFAEYCESLKDKLSEREKKYDLIQFSTFGENDKGLDFFQMIGFYKLGDFVVFMSEPDSPKPLQRLTKFVEYYKAKFNIVTRPKKDYYDVLGGLDLSEE